jgi:hypothetical protein
MVEASADNTRLPIVAAELQVAGQAVNAKMVELEASSAA